MARVTIASLTAQLEASHVAYERLATAHAALVAEHKRAVDLVQEHTAPVRVAPQPALNARRAAMAQARAEAMATGRTVRAL